MSTYYQLANGARRQVTRLTRKGMADVAAIYEQMAERLAAEARGGLYERRSMALLKEVEAYRQELAREMNRTVTNSLTEAAEIGSSVNAKAVQEIFARAGVGIKPSFVDMFGRINNEIVQDIIGGGLYKDNRTLSDRIWRFTGKNQRDLQHVIAEGIASGRSAVELAEDLRQYVKRPERRFTDWGKVYPRLNGVSAEYNAMRLARTAINHAYQGSTIKSSALNPFVKGIKWQSDMGHRTCELCKERHGKIYQADDVPLDHPNGLCVMIPHVPYSFDKIAGSLRNWLDGEENTILDDWFTEHGDHFAYKTKFNTYNK